jgi:polysaccharide biosynthesis/export protein
VRCTPRICGCAAVVIGVVGVLAPAFAQTRLLPPSTVGANKPPTVREAPAGVTAPPDYIIGAEDILSVFFWKDKDLTTDATVRPDGKISLPLLNDMQAAGLTPEQLRVAVTEAAAKWVEEPTVTVVVKAMNSRKVFITGQVARPGPYALNGPITVLQLIAMAGGVHEFADSENIAIMRVENARPVSFRFNYKDVQRRKNLTQNIELKPGDTVVVP